MLYALCVCEICVPRVCGVIWFGANAVESDTNHSAWLARNKLHNAAVCVCVCMDGNATKINS